VLEYVADVSAALAELYRVLRPGGRPRLERRLDLVVAFRRS